MCDAHRSGEGGILMTESVDIVAHLDAGRRVVLVSGRKDWGRPAWLIQTMVGGAWHDGGVTRSSDMLRWLAGPVDADAAAILAALPARVDLRVRGSSMIKRAPGKRARAAELRAAVAVRAAEKRVRIAAPGAGTNRAAAAAAAFLTWRAGQKENASEVRRAIVQQKLATQW
jgi:hypothetical protein